MDKELLYNQSGIKDETAYKAITNIQNRSKAGMNGYITEINKGEIWEVQIGEYTKHAVILACYGEYAATVILQKQEPPVNAVPIRVRDVMYADAGKLGWIFYDKTVDYVRTLSAEENRELRQAIGAALELEVNKVSAATIAEALEQRDKAREAAQQYENMAADANREIEGLQYEIVQLRKELEAANEVAENQAKELEEAYDHMEANAARVDELVKQTEETRQENAEQIAKEAVGMLEELAAARREAEIYKGLYENMLARALG